MKFNFLSFYFLLAAECGSQSENCNNQEEEEEEESTFWAADKAGVIN